MAHIYSCFFSKAISINLQPICLKVERLKLMKKVQSLKIKDIEKQMYI